MSDEYVVQGLLAMKSKAGRGVIMTQLYAVIISGRGTRQAFF